MVLIVSGEDVILCSSAGRRELMTRRQKQCPAAAKCSKCLPQAAVGFRKLLTSVGRRSNAFQAHELILEMEEVHNPDVQWPPRLDGEVVLNVVASCVSLAIGLSDWI